MHFARSQYSLFVHTDLNIPAILETPVTTLQAFPFFVVF